MGERGREQSERREREGEEREKGGGIILLDYSIFYTLRSIFISKGEQQQLVGLVSSRVEE
jgi:hypothetical protein